MGERFTVAKEGERPSRSTDVGRVLRANLVLIAGAIAWWGCHYLLLWNADVAAADRFVAGYDSRFMLSIGGTVIALGVLAFAAYRKPGFVYANWAPAYGLFAVLSFVALGLVFTPLFTNEPTALVTVGAVLSGMGNGIAMTIYGELHARLELRVLPLLFALEIVGGGLIFLLSPAWPPVALPLSLALAALCAVCFFRTSRANNAPSSLGSVCGTAAVDMGLRSLVVLAALTGVGYGMARTFTVGVGTPADIANGLTAEWIGSCCSALLLVAVFLFQKRLSLFELCLLFVVPLVATGLWLVSLRGDARCTADGHQPRRIRLFLRAHLVLRRCAGRTWRRAAPHLFHHHPVLRQPDKPAGGIARARAVLQRTFHEPGVPHFGSVHGVHVLAIENGGERRYCIKRGVRWGLHGNGLQCHL